MSRRAACGEFGCGRHEGAGQADLSARDPSAVSGGRGMADSDVGRVATIGPAREALAGVRQSTARSAGREADDAGAGGGVGEETGRAADSAVLAEAGDER